MMFKMQPKCNLNGLIKLFTMFIKVQTTIIRKQ